VCRLGMAFGDCVHVINAGFLNLNVTICIIYACVTVFWDVHAWPTRDGRNTELLKDTSIVNNHKMLFWLSAWSIRHRGHKSLFLCLIFSSRFYNLQSFCVVQARAWINIYKRQDQHFVILILFGIFIVTYI